MNENLSFERNVAEHIANEGVAPPSDAFYNELVTSADRHGQRPRWLALIKEPPMRIESRIAVGSPTARVAAIMVATLLLAISLAAAGLAGSRLLAADGAIVVDQSGAGDYTTITEAVTAADDGDEILVMPGTYAEEIIIANDITLRGEDRDGVVVALVGCDGPEPAPAGCDEDGGPRALSVDGASPTITNLTVGERSSGFGTLIHVDAGSPRLTAITATGEPGAVFSSIVGGSAAEFVDVFIDGPIEVSDSPASFVDSRVGALEILNAESGAVAQVSNSELGSLVTDGPNTIAGNTISIHDDFDADVGLAISGDGWSISANTVSGFATGIRQQAGTGEIVDNTLIDNGVGMSVRVDPGVRVESNAVEGGDTGIQVRGDGVLASNTVTGTMGTGIDIGGSSTLTLTGNISCDNGENLAIGARAEPTVDETNDICAAGGSELLVASDGSAAFDTIAAAVEAAAEGDTVKVAPGTYAEWLVIDKAVSIEGDAPNALAVTIEVPASAPALPAAVATSCHVGCTGTIDGPVGIFFDGVDASLSKLTVVGHPAGQALVIHGGAPTLIDVRVEIAGESTTISDSAPRGGLTVDRGSTATVRELTHQGLLTVDGGASPSIADSTLDDTCVVVRGEGSAPEFRGGVVRNCADGWTFDIGSGSAPMVDGNSISLGGIRVTDTGTTASIIGNTILGMVDGTGNFRRQDEGGTAIEIGPGTAVTIDDNEIKGFERAVAADEAEISMDSNSVGNNTVGLYLDDVAATFGKNWIAYNDVGITALGDTALPEYTDEEIWCNGVDFETTDRSPSKHWSEVDGC